MPRPGQCSGMTLRLAGRAVDKRARRRSVGGVKRLAFVGVLAAATFGLAAWKSSQAASAEARSGASMAARGSERGVSAATLSASRLILGGRIRCTATLGSVVQAGKPVKVKFALHNRSRHVVYVPPDPWLVVRAADGTTYDTRTDPYPGTGRSSPPVLSALRRGATMHLSSTVPVRWRGRLQITPGCVFKALPALRVRVTSPGAPSDASAAVAEVVAAAGHVFDRCRPQTPGVPVDGQIDPPSGSTPPMSARCSLSFTSEGSFWIAQALAVSPPGPPVLQVWQPYETLWQPGLPPPMLTPPYEEIAWEFVVTRDGATPVAAATAWAAYPSNQLAPLWYWSGTGWQFGGSGQCGGSFFLPSWAYGFTGPDISFISACSAPTP